MAKIISEIFSQLEEAPGKRGGSDVNSEREPLVIAANEWNDQKRRLIDILERAHLGEQRARVLLHLNRLQEIHEVADPELLVIGISAVHTAKDRPPNRHRR